jgi:hypothetical protein
MAWAEWEQMKEEAAGEGGTQIRLDKAGPGVGDKAP